mgnify:CR=1 FL=1
MKYTTMYGHYQESMKKARVKGPRVTPAEHKYRIKAIRQLSPLYKKAVKLIQAQGGKKPIQKHYGTPGAVARILRKAYMIAKSKGL